MKRSTPLLARACCSLLALTGCGLVDSLSPDDPPIPGDFPQLDAYDSARVDVAVGDDRLDATGTCRYDDSGVDDDKLRFGLSVDFLDFDVRDRDEGEYSSVADEVTASWSETTNYESSAACGESRVRFDGAKTFDGIVDNQLAIWGTLQLIVCGDDGVALEISGKFSCVI